MKKIILALDVLNIKKAERLINETSIFIDIYKVGPILFLRSGKEIIKILKKNKKKIFLDLKFYDIPNTVKYAVESAKKLGIFSLTVHSIGGLEMLKAAVSVKNGPKIWAVTVLTSQIVSQEEIVKRARLAKLCGVDGVISSPQEIILIKKECGKNFNIITPGIRNIKTNDDQKRTATPEFAIKYGASFIIIGRPIIKAKNPYKITKDIYNKIKTSCRKNVI
ncbi:MAG: orotidine-5'-phosphate decarboxylase [Endomicrobium sp.]|jgi:orotidine-5'-phosphate decarboxylase|nr:orotidine-5'-phosphate decarboxylase [Endomicrobium sp.]